MECKSHLREAQYAEAEALERGGELQAAYEMFSALDGYRDAANRAETLAAQLGIEP